MVSIKKFMKMGLRQMIDAHLHEREKMKSDSFSHNEYLRNAGLEEVQGEVEFNHFEGPFTGPATFIQSIKKKEPNMYDDAFELVIRRDTMIYSYFCHWKDYVRVDDTYLFHQSGTTSDHAKEVADVLQSIRDNLRDDESVSLDRLMQIHVYKYGVYVNHNNVLEYESQDEAEHAKRVLEEVKSFL